MDNFNREDFLNQANSKVKGNQAELLAEQYLTEKSFKIIKKNFQFGKAGEIDIIAYHGNDLVFIEVKSRSTEKYGEIEYFVPFSKQQKIRKVAEGFLYVHKIIDKPCRFDVVFVDFINKEPVIKHIENAF